MSTLPDLAKLAPKAQMQLIEFGAPLLLAETEGRLALAEKEISAFEQKHRTTLAQLQQDGLPEDASVEMHEDFVEWSGWQRTYAEFSQILASLKPLLENR